jgi:hypothetical protein
MCRVCENPKKKKKRKEKKSKYGGLKSKAIEYIVSRDPD